MRGSNLIKKGTQLKKNYWKFSKSIKIHGIIIIIFNLGKLMFWLVNFLAKEGLK